MHVHTAAAQAETTRRDVFTHYFYVGSSTAPAPTWKHAVLPHMHGPWAWLLCQRKLLDRRLGNDARNAAASNIETAGLYLWGMLGTFVGDIWYWHNRNSVPKRNVVVATVCEQERCTQTSRGLAAHLSVACVPQQHPPVVSDSQQGVFL